MKKTSLINKEICGEKMLFSKLHTIKGKNFFNATALNEIFKKTNILNITEKEICDILDGSFPAELFYTKEEEFLNKEILKKRILRYQKWENSQSIGCTFLNGGNHTVFIEKEEILVDYSFIKVDYKNKVATVYKVRNKKNPLKKGGRTPFTSISKNKELFLLQAVGRSMFPSFDCYGCVVFLTHPDDKNSNVSESFQLKDFENVIQSNYTKEQIEIMEKQILAIINSKDRSCNKSGECENCSYNNICSYKEQKNELTIIPPSPKSSRTVSFTTPQQNFINFNNGIVRVIAGAGSGKTTVIANNVVKLLEGGVLPQDILLITFTNKGVEEIKEKLSYWADKKSIKIDIKDINIFTFNGFGDYLIKKEYLQLGYTAEPKLLDKMSQITYLKETLNKFPTLPEFNYVYPFMDMRYAKGVVIKLGEIFENIKRLGFTSEYEASEEFKVTNEIAIQLLLMYRYYNELLKNNNIIEFNDQVPLAFELLSKQENLNKYGYNHIICDEFQDSDSSQINLLSLLKSYKYNKSLCICGDDSQSIFGWRGANVSNIIDFQNYFPNVNDIKMIQNFRSTIEICDIANKIDSLNKTGIKKKLKSFKNGENPYIRFEGDIDAITSMVDSNIKTGKLKPSDIAIISRTKKRLIIAQEQLTENKIPSVISVAETLIDNPKIRNIIGFSNFLLDQQLDFHFCEYLQIIKYKEFTEAKNKDFSEFEKFILDEKSIFLSEYEKCITNEDKLDFIYNLLEKLTVDDEIVKKLLSQIKEMNFITICDLVSYLNNLILYKSDDYVEKTNDIYEAVTLITAHSAKGKEYKKVFIDLASFKYDESNDESVKILFVAITRAKEQLALIGKTSLEFMKVLLDK